MLIRKKGIFIASALLLLGVASVVRVGAQKPAANKPAAGNKAPLASSMAVVGHPVGFAETRPVHELMDAAGLADRELQE